MSDVVRKLRHDLANSLGVEKTPDEVEQLLSQATALYEIIDIDTYRHMRDLTIGQCVMEARKDKFKTMGEFFLARDIMLFVGERKYPDEPKRKDKASW